MFKIKGFTLAEVLITLAIIGVVAALTIPSVISNSQQQEFKTGLRKAVSVLNSAITMNMAIDGESPYDNQSLYTYLQRHMSVMKSTTRLPYKYRTRLSGTTKPLGGHADTNAAFYTTDGIRFEFDNNYAGALTSGPMLHESKMRACIATVDIYNINNPMTCSGCGSYGLKQNPNNTTKRPCSLLIDVNGDRKPSPSNVNCNSTTCEPNNWYTYPSPDAKSITDIFTILITEDRAIPYGVVAQRAMYQAQK